METTLKTAALVAVAIGAAVALRYVLPELSRYFKMKSM